MSAQQIFDKAFEPGREPRSDAYKRGVMRALLVRVDGVQHALECPYLAGTAERDAYYAGIEEGRALSPVAPI